MTTVLIVEQDDATRELYQRELGRTYHVLASDEVEHASQLLQSMEIDAMVLEPTVSEGQGWILLERLSRKRPHKPLPVILCSTLDERRRGMSLGATAYLVKPVMPITLLDALNQVLQV